MEQLERHIGYLLSYMYVLVPFSWGFCLQIKELPYSKCVAFHESMSVGSSDPGAKNAMAVSLLFGVNRPRAVSPQILRMRGGDYMKFTVMLKFLFDVLQAVESGSVLMEKNKKVSP